MRVKIKTWEKMEEEFGLNGDWIPYEEYFTDLTGNVMPQDMIMDIQYKDGYMYWNGWEISEDMIEEYLDLDEKEDYIENLEFENKKYVRVFTEFRI